MLIRRIVALCITSLLLIADYTAAQTRANMDLTGNWIAEMSNADVANGPTNYFRFTLQQHGSDLTGTLGASDQLAGTLRTNGEFELRDTWPNGSQIWRGTVKGDVLIAVTSDEPSKQRIRAYRDPFKPTEPRTRVFEPKEFHRLFSGSIAPALHISPGDTVRTWTVDAAGKDSNGVQRSAGGNPQTGPFYIEGALPGDTLVVHLDKVRLNRATAFSTNTLLAHAVDPHYFASLPALERNFVHWQLDRERGIGMLATPSDKLRNYSVTLRPMLGCIGVAPADRMSFRTGQLGAYGGNLDYNLIVEGTTVYLPIFQVGALLFVGDGHAMQGDGELAGNALETSLDVEFKVDLIRGRSAGAPRAESAEYRMAMGIAGSLNEALQQATTNMARWLQEDYALERDDLTAVLSTSMNYDIAEVVGRDYHVVARISKQALGGVQR